jgi:L-lysine 2,3-aminomutase
MNDRLNRQLNRLRRNGVDVKNHQSVMLQNVLNAPTNEVSDVRHLMNVYFVPYIASSRVLDER